MKKKPKNIRLGSKVKKPSALHVPGSTLSFYLVHGRDIMIELFGRNQASTQEFLDEVDVKRIIKWLNQYLKWYEEKKENKKC